MHTQLLLVEPKHVVGWCYYMQPKYSVCQLIRVKGAKGIVVGENSVPSVCELFRLKVLMPADIYVVEDLYWKYPIPYDQWLWWLTELNKFR